jgi:hypothetical protein
MMGGGGGDCSQRKKTRSRIRLFPNMRNVDKYKKGHRRSKHSLKGTDDVGQNRQRRSMNMGIGCGVAQIRCGVAQLGCGVALLGCGVAQIIARRLAVRQARVRISARQPRGGPLPSGKQ